MFLHCVEACMAAFLLAWKADSQMEMGWINQEIVWSARVSLEHCFPLVLKYLDDDIAD